MPGWMLVSRLNNTVVKFWKSELKLPDGIEKNTKEVVKYTMRTAWQSFPYWHRIVHRQKDATPVTTKKLMDNLIGKYLSRIKATSKLILQFLYGLPGDKDALPKRERIIEGSDILEQFKFVRLGIDGVQAEEICAPAVMTALLSFHKTDEHYTYTLDDAEEECDNESSDDSDSEDSIDSVESNEQEETPHFIDF